MNNGRWSSAIHMYHVQTDVLLIGDDQAFLLGRIVADEAEVLTLATHPALQRQGRAAQMLATFLAQARVAQATRTFLEVAADNHPAMQLYQKAGFQQVGRRQRYYRAADGKFVDALVLALQLT